MHLIIKVTSSLACLQH